MALKAFSLPGPMQQFLCVCKWCMWKNSEYTGLALQWTFRNNTRLKAQAAKRQAVTQVSKLLVCAALHAPRVGVDYLPRPHTSSVPNYAIIVSSQFSHLRACLFPVTLLPSLLLNKWECGLGYSGGARLLGRPTRSIGGQGFSSSTNSLSDESET